LNIHDISGMEEQYDPQNESFVQWDLQNHAMKEGVQNDDVEFYTKDAITVPEISLRQQKRKEIASNFSSELETAQALAADSSATPESEAAADIWRAMPYSYGPQSNPFENERRLDITKINPITSAEENIGGFNVFVQTDDERNDHWEEADKLYADTYDRKSLTQPLNNDDVMRSVNNAPIIVGKNKAVDTAAFVEDLDRLSGAYNGQVSYA